MNNNFNKELINNSNKFIKPIKELSNIDKYNNNKAVYLGFIKKMNKSEFSNSISRYETELTQLEHMKELLASDGNPKELEFINNARKNAIEKLRKLGVIVKE